MIHYNAVVNSRMWLVRGVGVQDAIRFQHMDNTVDFANPCTPLVVDK
jgi:hypothetical protein